MSNTNESYHLFSSFGINMAMLSVFVILCTYVVSVYYPKTQKENNF